MYRKIISDGDLMLMEKPWYRFFSQRWEPFRNLSEEVRLLKEHRDNALSKYLELSRSYVVGSTNVADELETLQLFLLDNSEAYFDVDIDNSILEEREGVRYNFNNGGGNNKKGSSSNKENQKQQQNNKQGQGKPKTRSLLSVLSDAQVSIH